MPANLNPGTDYTQPALPKSRSGFRVNCIDMQIITKQSTWNQSADKRALELEEIARAHADYVAHASPYDDSPAKWSNYTTEAHGKGFKMWHRAHWNKWQGDNGASITQRAVTSITRSGTTATVTTATAHGYTTGDVVPIRGATQTDYNGDFTITVLTSTTFTYTVANSPATPATTSDFIESGMGATAYLDMTYDFIVAHAAYFQAGDFFTFCVESSQADTTTNYTFRVGGVVGGAFSFARYNQFEKDQVRYANAAFTAIGLGGKVHTWAISHSVTLTNLNGQTWGGSGGNASGLGDSDFATYFAGRVCFDHYESSSIRDGISYYNAFNTSLGVFRAAFPSCYGYGKGYFQGEIGYHTTVNVDEFEQYSAFEQIMKVLRGMQDCIGVNVWNHLGQTSSSLWSDNSGTIIQGGKMALQAVKRAFRKGTAYDNYVISGTAGVNNWALDQGQFAGSAHIGFGQTAQKRYRGQVFKPTQATLSAIGFNVVVPHLTGMEVYLTDVDQTTNLPTGSVLASWFIPLERLPANLFCVHQLTSPYTTMTPGHKYAFYLAPFSGGSYTDDYRDLDMTTDTTQLSALPHIQNDNGVWSVDTTITMVFATCYPVK